MAGIIDGYSKLHEVLFSLAQSLGSFEVLVPILSVVGLFIVCALVVGLDGDPGRHVERIFTAFSPSVAAIPIFIGLVWLANGGFDSLMKLTEGTPEGNVLVVFVLFILQLFLILAGAVTGLTFALIMLACLVVIAYSVVRASPDLVMVLFLSLRPVSRGLATILVLPWKALRSVFYFFTQPPSLRRMKKVVRTKDADPEGESRAAQEIIEDYNRVKKAHPKEYSEAKLDNLARQYGKVADAMSASRARSMSDYNRSVERVARELEERARKRPRSGATRDDE